MTMSLVIISEESLDTASVARPTIQGANVALAMAVFGFGVSPHQWSNLTSACLDLPTSNRTMVWHSYATSSSTPDLHPPPCDASSLFLLLHHHNYHCHWWSSQYTLRNLGSRTRFSIATTAAGYCVAMDGGFFSMADEEPPNCDRNDNTFWDDRQSEGTWVEQEEEMTAIRHTLM